jgi:hypothetical protein
MKSKYRIPGTPAVLQFLNKHGFAAEAQAVERAIDVGAGVDTACKAAIRALLTIPETPDWDVAEGAEILDLEGSRQ